MNNNTQKGFKPFIFKFVVIAMSMCYVLGPLHKDISNLLHIVSHQLEMENSGVAHASLEHTNHDQLHHFNSVSENHHSHKILDVLNHILEASNTETNTDNDTENHEKLIKKIDKHTRIARNFKTQNSFPYFKLQQKDIFKIEKIHSGFINGIIQPPRLS